MHSVDNQKLQLAKMASSKTHNPLKLGAPIAIAIIFAM